MQIGVFLRFFVEKDQTRAIREGKNFAKTLTCAIFFYFER